MRSPRNPVRFKPIIDNTLAAIRLAACASELCLPSREAAEFPPAECHSVFGNREHTRVLSGHLRPAHHPFPGRTWPSKTRRSHRFGAPEALRPPFGPCAVWRSIHPRCSASPIPRRPANIWPSNCCFVRSDSATTRNAATSRTTPSTRSERSRRVRGQTNGDQMRV